MAHLIRSYMVKYSANTRDAKDRRKKVAKAIFSYTERDTGFEFRRSFTAPINTSEIAFYDIAPRIIIDL